MARKFTRLRLSWLPGLMAKFEICQPWHAEEINSDGEWTCLWLIQVDFFLLLLFDQMNSRLWLVEFKSCYNGGLSKASLNHKKGLISTIKMFL